MSLNNHSESQSVPHQQSLDLQDTEMFPIVSPAIQKKTSLVGDHIDKNGQVQQSLNTGSRQTDLQGASNPSITIDKFMIRNDPETSIKNENIQLGELILINNLKKLIISQQGENQPCPSEQDNGSSDQKDIGLQWDNFRQMLVNSHSELTYLIDLCHFLNMSPEQVSQFFQVDPMSIDQPRAPFVKKRLQFNIKPEQAKMQTAYDYAMHLNSIQTCIDTSTGRINQIKDQVSRDKIEFRLLLQLRKKYQITEFKKDPLFISQSKVQQSNKQANLFVINLEYKKPSHLLDSHPLILELRLMKKVILQCLGRSLNSKNNGQSQKTSNNKLTLNFAPKLRQLKHATVKVGINIVPIDQQQNNKDKFQDQGYFEQIISYDLPVIKKQQQNQERESNSDFVDLDQQQENQDDVIKQSNKIDHVKKNQNYQTNPFEKNTFFTHSKSEQDDSQNQLEMIDNELKQKTRLIMLYETFVKMAIEAQTSKRISINHSDFSIQSSITVSNLVRIDLNMRFFVDSSEEQKQNLQENLGDHIKNQQFYSNAFMKNLILNLVENSPRANLISKLNFILASKAVGDIIKSRLIGDQSRFNSDRGAINIHKQSVPYQSSTWTVLVNTRKFYSHKMTKDLSKVSQSERLTLQKVSQITDVPLPRFKITMKVDNSDKTEQQFIITCIEDCLDSIKHQGNQQLEWNLEQSYWINFHQMKSPIQKVSQVDRIKKFIDSKLTSQ